MPTVLLDSHVLHWVTSAPNELSRSARRAVENSELAVSGITWWELANLARRERIRPPMSTRSWLDGIARSVRTIGITPAIAETAAALPSSFPNDPSDRLIYATAVEHGLALVTKDERMRAAYQPRAKTIW